jgi:hypothetical protein
LAYHYHSLFYTHRQNKDVMKPLPLFAATKQSTSGAHNLGQTQEMCPLFEPEAQPRMPQPNKRQE